jgi:hypothetical protein
MAFVSVLLLGGSVMAYRHFTDPGQVLLAKIEVQEGAYGVIPAWWLDDHFGASVCDFDLCKYEADPDDDNLTNGQEYYYRSNPNESDTNKNGLSDGDDVSQDFDPSKEGKVTFEEAGSDLSILGESLVFDKDIKAIYYEETDISKVGIQIIPDSKLDISHVETQEEYEAYADDFKDAVNNYFPAARMAEAMLAFEKGTLSEASGASKEALALSLELGDIRVPSRLVAFHKYNIALYQVLYDLMVLEDKSADMDSPESDVWYDKAQALLAILQKLDLEKAKLSNY